MNHINVVKFCPPIFVKGMSIKHLNNYIQKNFDKNLKVKYLSQGEQRFKVSVNDSNVHIKLIELFRKNEVNAYSFTPKDRKKTTVLLKGMDCDFTTDEIRDSILQVVPELKISKVAPFTTGYSKSKNRRLNMFLVQLEAGEEIKKLIDIKYLLFQRVYCEKLYKTDVIRCYRCQWFGHSGYFCSLPLKCVLCSGKHDLSDCLKKGIANSDLKCANCNGNHSASSKKCEKYNEYKERREGMLKRTKEIAEKRKKFVQQSVNNFVNENITFAELAKSGNNVLAHNAESNTLQDFINESRRLFKLPLVELIKKIRTFWATYKRITSEEEKCFAYLEFVSSITT